MIDTLFVIYFLMLVVLLGLAIASDARRRSRRRAVALQASALPEAQGTS